MSAPTRYVVFLRAINTGHRRLTNDDLLAPFHRAGFDAVAAYQAAGNITFRTDDPDAVRTEALDALLADAYGFDAPAFVRTFDELRDVAATTPFTPDDMAGTEGRVQVAFLREPPAEPRVADVAALVPPEDCVVVTGREVFWLPRTGVAGSQLPVGAVERLLGPMTIRTLGTVQRLLAKFAD